MPSDQLSPHRNGKKQTLSFRDLDLIATGIRFPLALRRAQLDGNPISLGTCLLSVTETRHSEDSRNKYIITFH